MSVQQPALSDDTRTAILKVNGDGIGNFGPVSLDATEDRRITSVVMTYADDGPGEDDVAGEAMLYLGTKTPQPLNTDMAQQDVDFFLEWHMAFFQNAATNVAPTTDLTEYFDFSGQDVIWERNVTLSIDCTFYFLTGDSGSMKALVFYEEL